MGVVYKARDLKLGRFLALQFPPEGALANETSRARLVREAQHASALSHPNIATIHDAGEDARRVYIATEHCPVSNGWVPVGPRRLIPRAACDRS